MKKIFFAFCNKDSNSRVPITPKACISSIPQELYITNGLPLYIIKPQIRFALGGIEPRKIKS